MKRFPVLLVSALLFGACGGDTGFPEATGKASIRAINAMPTSQEIAFLIEETPIASARYQEATAAVRYDDLDYTFNFEVLFTGESALRRIASRSIDFVADKDYTLLVTGTLANPTLTLWEGDERSFDEADTVLEARFAHVSASQGALDFYFAEPSVAPALGEQVATLSFGEISTAADFTEGDFVLTVTAAGDPGAIMYVSDTTTFAPRSASIVTVFDGSSNGNAPLIVRAINSSGGGFSLPDPRFAPSVEFINSSMDLGTSDIYDDEALTSLRVTDHAFLNISDELDIAVGANTFFYTPAGDTTAVTLEGTLTAIEGLRYRLVATGEAGALAAAVVIPDRRPVGTQVKVLPYHTSNNFDLLDIYAVDAGETIDEAFPILGALPAAVQINTLALAAGSYDIYITESQDTVILAGPYRIDVVLGDIVDMIVVDTVDPAVLDILFLSGGPTL